MAAMAVMAWFMNTIGTVAEIVHGNFRGDNGEPYHVVVKAKIQALQAQWKVITTNMFSYLNRIADERIRNHWNNVRHRNYLPIWNDYFAHGNYGNGRLSHEDMIVALRMDCIDAYREDGFTFIPRANVIYWDSEYFQHRAAIANGHLAEWEGQLTTFNLRGNPRPLRFTFYRYDIIRAIRPEILFYLEDRYEIIPPHGWNANSV